VPSGFYFFVYMNRIETAVELKFYIGVQEECIRVKEEFVVISLLASGLKNTTHQTITTKIRLVHEKR